MDRKWPHTTICSDDADPAQAIYDELGWASVTIVSALEILGIKEPEDREAVRWLNRFLNGSTKGGPSHITFGFDGSRWDIELNPMDEDLTERVKSLDNRFSGEKRDSIRLIAEADHELNLGYLAHEEGRYLLALRLMSRAQIILNRACTVVAKCNLQDRISTEPSDKKRAEMRLILDSYSPVSKNARKAADARHAENREIAERIKAWYIENHHRFRSLDAAAEAATRIEPVVVKTARKHIGDAAKKIPSARKE
jgi:hypothetical protein